MAVTKFTTEVSDGSVWDIAPLATSIDWETDTDFSAGTLTFDLLEVNEGYVPKNGDRIEFQWDGIKVFKGRIFKVDYDSDEVFSVTAYDNLRYLKNQDMIVWGVGKLSTRFGKIAKAAGNLSYKNSSDSNIKLAEEIQDGQTYFDRISEWGKEIRQREGLRVFVRDVYGKIEIVAQKDQGGDYLVLSDKSLTTAWSYNRTIDDTANSVKLVRETKDKKQRSVYTTKSASNSNSVQRYGLLQIVEKADDKLNDAQMERKVKQILKEHNMEKKTFSIKAVGSMDVGPRGMRAGERFYIDIDSLRDIGIGMRRMFATRVHHKFGTNWTMDIEMELD